MSFSNDGHLEDHHRKLGASHDSLPTPNLTLLENTPTMTQIINEENFIGQNPFDVIFRKAIGSTSEPQPPLLNGPSISVSTPNTADLLAIIGGAVMNTEGDGLKQQLVVQNSSPAAAEKIVSNLAMAMNIEKPSTSEVPKTDVRRSPKKSNLIRQDSATQNDSMHYVELQTAQQTAANFSQIASKPGAATIESQTTAPRARSIAKKRTSLSIKMPGNASTSPLNDAPSVSSSTDEGAPQPLTVVSNLGTQTILTTSMNDHLLGGSQRQALMGASHSQSGVQLGEAFLAQFDHREGVQTPTTAEVINTAIEMHADSGKLHPTGSTITTVSAANLAVLSNPLAAASYGDVKSNIASPQRGAHANVNVNAVPPVAATKVTPVRTAVAAPTLAQAAAPAPVAAPNGGNGTLLSAGGQMFFLPANIINATQQSGPVYIIAQPNTIGTTQLIPASGNTTLLLPGGGQQTVTALNVQQPQPATTATTAVLQAAPAASARVPSAKEALKRAINQPKGAATALEGASSGEVAAKTRRIAVAALDQAGVTKRADMKQAFAGGSGVVLQHAAVDSTTRMATQQLAVVQNGPVAINLAGQNAIFATGQAQSVNFATAAPQNSTPTASASVASDGASPADVELVRRQRFLERNRAAAARCRQRRKHYTETLQDEVNSLKQLVAKQSSQITTQRKQIAHLKLLLLAHKDCPVTDEQSRQGLFSALVPNDLDSTPSASTPESANCGTQGDGPSSAGAHALATGGSIDHLNLDAINSEEDEKDEVSEATDADPIVAL